MAMLCAPEVRYGAVQRANRIRNDWSDPGAIGEKKHNKFTTS